MMSYNWTQNYYDLRHLLFQKSLTHLFCLSYMSRVVPSDRKLARITPIYKGKDPLNSETNYRPISVLSHVVKILEKQAHKQLIEYLETYAFITPYQSAYFKKHSTVTHLHRVVDDLCESIDDGYLVEYVFWIWRNVLTLSITKYYHKNWSITVLTQCLSNGSKTIYMIVHNVYESTISHQKKTHAMWVYFMLTIFHSTCKIRTAISLQMIPQFILLGQLPKTYQANCKELLTQLCLGTCQTGWALIQINMPSCWLVSYPRFKLMWI